MSVYTPERQIAAGDGPEISADAELHAHGIDLYGIALRTPDDMSGLRRIGMLVARRAAERHPATRQQDLATYAGDVVTPAPDLASIQVTPNTIEAAA